MHPARQMDLAWAVFLLTKPKPRLTGRRCTQRRADLVSGGMEGFMRMPGSQMMRCSRPVWGDGAGIGGKGEGLCSRCWHEYNAFHGAYTTMQANPAASQLSGASILRRTDIFGRRGDALPEIGGQTPDTLPNGW